MVYSHSVTRAAKWFRCIEQMQLSQCREIMSGSGIVYAGQCEEKVARAYLLVGNTSLTSFQDAARKRLCCSHASQGVQDDLALTQRRLWLSAA